MNNALLKNMNINIMMQQQNANLQNPSSTFMKTEPPKNRLFFFNFEFYWKKCNFFLKAINAQYSNYPNYSKQPSSNVF